jgi:chromosome segregation and condensation protein ScpB
LKTETALIEAILFLEPEPVHINALRKSPVFPVMRSNRS